jgi:signal transduction histidine kinase/ActR/RegA family two-component response regulator
MLDWRFRLQTQVAVAVTLVVAFALGAAMIIATRVVTSGSLDRAATDLAAARSAFYRLQDDRGEFAAAQATLVTQLPVFRAHLTDSRLAADAATLQVLVDEYRVQLKSAFCIVTGKSATWTAASGWPGRERRSAPIDRMIAAATTTGRPQRELAAVGDKLFLVVSEPAQFAEETLGTLSVGYALDDGVARQLAEVTHSQVNIVAGRRLAASSLTGAERLAIDALVARGELPATGDAPRMQTLDATEYVAAAFRLTPNDGTDAPGRLVLLQDWGPTSGYLRELRRQLLYAGLIIFTIALAGGLAFAHRVAGPLSEIASAAGDIAAGNWARRIPVAGAAEAMEMARAFNEMTNSLRHWYDEAKRRDDELRQAQKMEAIGRLAGGIAHDFNNLLTAIRGYAELVAFRMNTKDPQHGEMMEILAAVDRAAELTKQLLAFSRRQTVTPRVLMLDQLLHSAEQMLKSVLGEDVRLITQIDRNIAPVRADRGQIEQVLLNLVINARDAMPRGGTLKIALSNVSVGAAPHDVQRSAVPDYYVCLSVTDTGHGMDRATGSRIFEPFFTTKEAGHGTGLGLAIVYEIVTDAGGMVDVDTEIGRGTTFRVYLPRLPEGEAVDVPAADTELMAMAARGSETVLVAEDDQRLGTLIGKTLRDAGYTVLQAAHGEEALDIARTHRAPIDLLITDVVMPGMSGCALFERVNSLRRETRVLYMSGYADDAVLRYGLKATAPFIRKPFSMDSLMNKMREALTPPSHA